ncbi:MAG: transposase, partial [Chitinophagaceae bacterium]|nr:transposase [Chitinophagaceae bacterium]
QNKANIENNPATYKLRQQLIEHTYGTVKRQWGFHYICTKRGLKRASADVGLMFTAYNLRRLMNSIDRNALKKFFQELVKLYFVVNASLKQTLALLAILFSSTTFYLPQKKTAANGF